MYEPGSESAIIGILGGMGPAATVDFYDKLVKATPATRDQDHLRVVMWADPTVPDRTRALTGSGEDPSPWLERGVRQLIGCGAGILAVPCNTIHAYMPAIVRGKNIDFVSIIDAATEAAKRATAARKIGLLATGAALSSGLYQRGLEAEDLEPVLPSQAAQEALMHIIYRIKAGDTGLPVCDEALSILEDLRGRGASTVIAACTEISILLAQLDTDIRIIDPSQALARKTVERAQAHQHTRAPAPVGPVANGDDKP